MTAFSGEKALTSPRSGRVGSSGRWNTTGGELGMEEDENSLALLSVEDGLAAGEVGDAE